MNASINRGSATIYQFPVRGRFAAEGLHRDAQASANATSQRPANVVMGSSWYHEEAIQDERARKN